MPRRITLLTEEQFDQIVQEGRAVEVLRTYVQRAAGRPSKGEAKLSNAERQRRWRENQKQQRDREKNKK